MNSSLQPSIQPVTPMLQDDEEPLTDMWLVALEVTNSYVVPAVGTFGLILNVLAIGTLIHMGINSSSMVYMLILAVGDIVSGFIDAIITVG